jgi:hypothetical protein
MNRTHWLVVDADGKETVAPTPYRVGRAWCVDLEGTSTLTALSPNSAVGLWADRNDIQWREVVPPLMPSMGDLASAIAMMERKSIITAIRAAQHALTKARAKVTDRAERIVFDAQIDLLKTFVTTLQETIQEGH